MRSQVFKSLLLACIVCLMLPTPSSVQERPLPDQDVFLNQVRARLQTDEERQTRYSYVETRRERTLDGSGATTGETVKVFESYPGFAPGERRWNRLVSENGRPVPASELEKKDRERQKKAQEYSRQLAADSEKVRADRVRRREKERRDNAQAVEDVFRVFDVRMLGREAIDGHDTIVFSMTPRHNATPRTREGKIMRHFAGKAWLSESDHELVRVEVEALDTVSFGLGVVARIHEGSRLSFERRKVNGEEWLPARAAYTVSGRVLLLKRIRTDIESEFANYRKFTVDTATTYGKPQ
jgi:hypothetical protein